MSTDTMCAGVQQIGETAGVLWRILDEQGSLSLTRLVKEAGVPRDLVMQALGWLAREDKLAMEDTSRGRIVSLKS